jgi:hypothetical protein
MNHIYKSIIHKFSLTKIILHYKMYKSRNYYNLNMVLNIPKEQHLIHHHKIHFGINIQVIIWLNQNKLNNYQLFHGKYHISKNMLNM